jgi:hypothetical protein
MAATTAVRQGGRALDVDGGLLTVRFMSFRSPALDARAGICGIWLVRLAPGTCWKRSGRDPSHKTRVPAPAGSSPDGKGDTPAGLPGSGCRRRYGWSRPEPPAGATPYQRQEPRALAKTGACGQPRSRTANRMVVPSSPSIRQRACPARLRPARTVTATPRGERTDHGCVLRHRLGRGRATRGGMLRVSLWIGGPT